jgi:hypothetical protein
MSKRKILRCRQCEERLGEEYKPYFHSLSRLCCSVDEEGEFEDELGSRFEEYACSYCNQTLKLEEKELNSKDSTSNESTEKEQ